MGSVPEQNFRLTVDHPVSLGAVGKDTVELDLSPDRPCFVTTEGVPVWAERKRQKTRFLDAKGNQVGPVHKNLFPALLWAWSEGWRDPSLPDWFNDGCIAEVAAGGPPPQSGQRGYTDLSLPEDLE